MSHVYYSYVISLMRRELRACMNLIMVAAYECTLGPKENKIDLTRYHGFSNFGQISKSCVLWSPNALERCPVSVLYIYITGISPELGQKLGHVLVLGRVQMCP